MKKITKMLLYKLLLVLVAVVLCANALEPYPEKTNISNSSALPFGGDLFTGFIQVNNATGSNIFYTLYGFNNGSINQDAPLIIWLDGGPGCASISGAFSAFGPIRVGSKAKGFPLSPRNLTWNTLGHLLTIDQPVGTGFSNALGGEVIKTTEQATVHFQVFIARFYQLFPNFINNDLYIVGESYAGHYIPAFAYQLLTNTSNSYIKLKGVVLGAPWTDGLRQVPMESDYYYTGSVATQKIRDYMHRIELTAVQAMLSGDYEYASDLTNYKTHYAQKVTLVDEFDIRKFNTDPWDPEDGSTDWLKLNTTQTILGIANKIEYIDCSDVIYNNMNADLTISYIDRLPLLLRSIKVLAYACQDDTAVQYSGVADYLRSVDWDGMHDIEMQPKKLWNVNGKIAGFYKNYLNYTYLTILKSGHVTPNDQPEPMFDLLNRFINNLPFN